MRIGIISGSNAVIERIIQIAHAIPKLNNYQIQAFTYTDLTEIQTIIQQNSALIDGWLFSGPNPYTVAQKYLSSGDNAVFCPVTGDEFYKHLITYMYKKQSTLIKASCDYPSTDAFDYSEFIDQLAVYNQSLFIHKYPIPFNADTIVKFHKKLHLEGKTTIAMTTLHSVYLALQQENIPVERLAASDAAIHYALNLLDQKLTSLYFKSAQVGLAIFKLSDYSSLIEKVGSSYKLQKLELELKNQLLDLSQEVNGYLSDKGNGYYEIFASRGLLEHSTELFHQSIAHTKIATGLTVTCGIGFGNTVFTAQLNAHRSLSHQTADNRSTIVIVDETGQLTECHNSGSMLIYKGITNEPDLLEKLKSANVTITTYNKIVAVINKLNLQTFTAAQLSQQLNVTERNIQRILAGLSKSNLVTCIGQETLNKRGRPTKKYKLTASLK